MYKSQGEKSATSLVAETCLSTRKVPIPSECFSALAQALAAYLGKTGGQGLMLCIFRGHHGASQMVLLCSAPLPPPTTTLEEEEEEEVEEGEEKKGKGNPSSH